MQLHSVFIATALLKAAIVGAQSSINLGGVISAAAGLASNLDPTSTPTTTSTSSPTPSTTSSVASSSTPTSTTGSSSTSVPATSSASATPTSDPNTGGIDPHTRTIIIAVCVTVGLLLLGALIGCIACCCLRRRRRNRRLANPETAEARRSEWGRGDNGHHGYISTESDLSRHPQIPAAAHQDSSPLMGESNHNTGPRTSIHPAYRQNSWDDPNINTQNPFTPNPPVTRKPVPIRHGHGNTALAAGAGAVAGAAATHYHRQKHEDHGYGDYPDRHSTSQPLDSNGHYPQTGQQEPIRDPNRPPTPFGLNAFMASGKRSSNGNTEHSNVSPEYRHPHSQDLDHPTEAQRRSLQEREMLAADVPVPERSPKRSSFGRGSHGVVNPHESPKPTFHDSGYAGYDSATSNESWQSAQAAPPRPQQQYYEDAHHYTPEPRHSEDNRHSDVPLVSPNPVWNRNHRNSSESTASQVSTAYRLYGPDGNPRRSIGADGKPRRLRFSDIQPEEYRYDYDNPHPVGQAL